MPVVALLFAFGIIVALLSAGSSRKRDSDSQGEQEAAPTPEPQHLAPFTFVLTLKPGVECFTPEPLPDGEDFCVTIAGVYKSHLASGYYDWQKADACFDAGSGQNFTKRYHGLHFDMRHVTNEPYVEDRHSHTYAFSYTSTGRKLSLLLDPPNNHQDVSGTLQVSIAPRFTPEEQAQQRAEAEQQAEEAARHEVEAEQRAKEEAEAQREARLYGMTLRFDLFPHYGDDAFIRRIATISQKSLLDRREEILQGHFTLHEDREFVTYFQERRPDLYERTLWQVKALALAEQLAAEQPAPALPRPKLTPEEHQAKIERFRARILMRQRIQAEDKMAELAQRLTLRRQIRDMLNEDDELDEDEKDQLLREFLDTVENPEDDTNGFKKL